MEYAELKTPSNPWLGQVISSAAASAGFPIDDLGNVFDFPSTKSVIVIVVDGLGWNLLLDRKGHTPNLRPSLNHSTAVNTCLPSTTAAALTSLSTGELPAATNMTGYSVAVDSGTNELEVMNLLNFKSGVVPEEWQQKSTYFEKITMETDGLRPIVISNPKFKNSGLTRSSLRGAYFYGATSLEQRFSLARTLAEEQPSLIYLYWSEIDHAGHKYGVQSQEWLGELEFFDSHLGRFLTRQPKDTSILLTADHGMVDVKERIDIAEHQLLRTGVRLLAGEGRAIHVHTYPDEAENVRRRWSDVLNEKAVVLAPNEYSQVFGSGPGLEHMGQAVVLMRGQSVIVDSRQHSSAMIAQKGVHGSFSKIETEVPVMVLS